MILHDITWYYMILHDITWYYMIFNIILHDITWYHTMSYHIQYIYIYVLTYLDYPLPVGSSTGDASPLPGPPSPPRSGGLGARSRKTNKADLGSNWELEEIHGELMVLF